MQLAVRDTRLFFDVDGAKLVPDGPAMVERPTLLLLHGGPGFDHSGFKPEFSVLTDLCQVVFLDHRGMGRSDHGSPNEWTLDTWATDVKAFCDATEITRPIVLGHSFGGYVACAYASRYPDHPGGLVLSGASAREDTPRILKAFERAGGRRARDAAAAFYADPGPATFTLFEEVCFPLYSRTRQDDDVQLRRVENLDVLFHFWGGELRTLDLLPELRNVRCPTLVLAGATDPITPIADAEEIVEALPSDLVSFVRFDNDGHALFRDSPEAYFAHLRAFIERAASSAVSSPA